MALSPEPNLGSRPLSPHLQVWRWHVTMLTSIMNRASGMGLTFGLLGVVLWIAAAAGGPAKFETLAALMHSAVGQVGLLLLAAAAAFHTAAGMRHLIFDAGRGLQPRSANTTAWLALAFTIVAPLALWWLAGHGGHS